MNDFVSFHCENGIVYGVTASKSEIPLLAVIAGSPVSGAEIVDALFDAIPAPNGGQ